MHTARNPFTSYGRRPTLAGASLPPRVRDALEDVLALVQDEILGRLDIALNELELQLSTGADRARNPVEQTARLAELRRVQRNRDALAPRVMELLQRQLAGLRDPATAAAAAPGPAAPISFKDLRLVEDDDADEDVVIRTLAMRHESRASLPLQLLGQRFGVLGARPALDVETLPVGPRCLATLVGEASDVLEITPDARLQLLREFDRHVLAGYEVVADAINGLLAQRNVLPSLAYVPLRRPARAMDPTPGHAGAGAPDAVPASASASAGGVVAMDASFAFVLELLARRRGVLGRLRAGPADAPVAAPTTDALRAALLPLQGEPASSPIEVRATLQSRGMDGLAVEQADVFELVGLLFRHLGRDLRPDAPAAELLPRLLVAVLRVALADPGFFEFPAHPVRLLLEDVAAAAADGVADDDADPQVDAALRQAVAQVVRDYDGDAQVFATAHQAVQDARQALARRAEVAERRQVDAARGKERLALAKHRAAETIDAAAGGARLPRFVRALLTQAWSDVLTLAALRHGPDSDEWHQQQRATADIVAAVTGARAAPPGLDVRVADALGAVGYDAAEAAAIAAHLTGATTEDSDDAASRTELMMRLKARTRLGEEAGDLPVAEAVLEPSAQAARARLAALPAGTWLDIDQAPGRRVRRRLAWVGEASGSVLLVNRRGQRVDEQSLDTLARRFAAGEARPAEAVADGLVARAWRATLASLRGFGDEGGAQA